jgi:uncharacterized protein YutE (UPF0331/DUF86 family)
MSPGRLDENVVRGKLEVLREMLRGIESLPLATLADLTGDPHMLAAGESYLRRALEALLDLGRHLLAKGFGIAAVEFKSIPRRLAEVGVLDEEQAALLTEMAGYRNRLVHEYHRVQADELHRILSERRGDLADLAEVLRAWVLRNLERLDRSL